MLFRLAFAEEFRAKGCAGFCRSHAADFSAGVSVIGLLVPEAVAYAGIAGMPPASGFVALFFGMLCYLLLGSSRFAVVSATSSSAMVLAATVGMQLTTHPNASPETLAAVLVMLTGFWFVLARFMGFGQIGNFVAKPVLRGVTMGLALTIILMQIPKLFGLHAAGASSWEKIANAASQVSSISPAAAAVGLISLAALFLWRWPRQPASLWVVACAVVATYFFPLEQMGVELVGDFELSGSALSLSTLADADWPGAIQMSAALCLMVYAESYSSIHSSAERHGDEPNANKDIFALGICNLTSGLFGGLAVGAGFSATSLNESAGAQSKVSTLTALLVFLIAVALLLPQVSRIPEPVLAAIVIKAVSHGLSWKPLVPYFKWRRDRVLVIASFFAVAVLGVLNGLLISVVLSVAFILIRDSKPHVSVLRRLPGSHSFVNEKLFTETISIPGVLVLRLDQPLFFANAEPSLKIAKQILAETQESRHITEVILSMEESADLDGTCVEMLLGFEKHVSQRGCTLTFCRLHRRARQVLMTAAYPRMPLDRLSLLSVDRAVKEALARIGERAQKQEQAEP